MSNNRATPNHMVDIGHANLATFISHWFLVIAVSALHMVIHSWQLRAPATVAMAGRAYLR